MPTFPVRNAVEAADSWKSFLARDSAEESRQSGDCSGGINDTDVDSTSGQRRKLRHHHHHHHHHHRDSTSNSIPTLAQIEEERNDEYLTQEETKKEKKKNKAERKHDKLLKSLRENPGIRESTSHGLLIDAGSTGSRMHLYEWEPRALYSSHDIQEAVSGRKLSYPGTDSRWTDRLRPGIATFAGLPDSLLQQAIADYLAPLMEFATATLREKQEDFARFPIFLRATAGMRTLSTNDRARVLGAVRHLFANDTFCPFMFQPEYARVLSGEEEAIFGWAGINFLMGHLVEESEGAGTVVSPNLTYGALDMGGASTQISFYEPNEDIMSNLFKLQIGQGKHWNLYAHSFLYYGINEARNRFHARVLDGANATQRLIGGMYNPCLPGGSQQNVRLNIHFHNGEETWAYNQTSESEYYNAVIINDQSRGDAATCLAMTEKLLHLPKNNWCDFSHKGDCSLAGVYQPELPRQSEHFGEFLAFSNYYEVWEFLDLPQRATMRQLKNATEQICSMSRDEVFAWNDAHAKADSSDVEDFCFRSAYAFQLLTNGYGFELHEHVTAANVIRGQKVGWALGAMLYELNTFPWEYVQTKHLGHDSAPPTDSSDESSSSRIAIIFLLVVCLGVIAAVALVLRARSRRNRHGYEVVK